MYYDYLIVGSGLFGATFAHFATKQGKKCLVIDKRPHWGGNVYCENIEGLTVVNYTSHDEPYTRVIEHKHFEMFGQEVYDCPKTVVSEEYSTEYKPGMEPYYPVNDDRNNALAAQYRELASQEKDVIFGGRLAEYKYYDMAPIIERVIERFN